MRGSVPEAPAPEGSASCGAGCLCFRVFTIAVFPVLLVSLVLTQQKVQFPKKIQMNIEFPIRES